MPRRHPDWIKVRPPGNPNYLRLKRILREKNLHTVCEEARCPNMGECWGHNTATFLVLGDTCTRGCRFCAIDKGKPLALDPEEPRNVALVVKDLGLDHIVVTSVNRDDRSDGSSNQFAKTVFWIKALNPAIRVEVLIPDFKGDLKALETVVQAGVHVFTSRRGHARCSRDWSSDVCSSDLTRIPPAIAGPIPGISIWWHHWGCNWCSRRAIDSWYRPGYCRRYPGNSFRRCCHWRCGGWY